ncbi:MAG TPA: nitrile hydratase subunit alpha [Solirubrobacterales bacterium]|jgi:nitrile hydratase
MSHGDHDHHHDGEHGHAHDHHPEAPDSVQARALALESLLVEKGLVTREAVDRIVEAHESKIGPLNGARVVARAWVDPEFKRRLLEDGTAACRELGIGGLRGEHLVVVENRPGVHNAIVCTLCSCYPWAVLGLPPAWYKSPAYRSRMVLEPREVLGEFGLELEPDTRVEVWDSSAETRYMVLPECPPGTGGLSEEELAALVTRDSMVGVGRPVPPVPA